MAVASVSLPKHWQDWCKWLLGFWLCISPWVLQFVPEFESDTNRCDHRDSDRFLREGDAVLLSNVGGMD